MSEIRIIEREFQEYKDLFGIYIIRNIVNGKIYIGKTEESFKRRYWHHTWCLEQKKHDNKHMERAYHKYGKDNFSFEVIHICNNSDDINKLEIQYIEQYDSFNNGYNQTLGGDGAKGFVHSEEVRKRVGEINRQKNLGKKHSEETKARMRASSNHLSPSKETIEKLRKHRTGITVSDSTKQKLREANTGSKSPVTKLNEDIVAEIKQRLIDGDKQTVVAKDYNVSHGAISAITKNRTWTHVVVDGWSEYSGGIHYKAPNRKFANDDIVNILQLLSNNTPVKDIAKLYSVGITAIYNIKNGKAYKDILYGNPVPSSE